MALPAVLLKAKGALKKGSQVYNAAKQAKELDVKSVASSLVINKFKLPIFAGLIGFVFILLIATLVFAYPRIVVEGLNPNYNLSGTGSAGNAGGSAGAISLDPAALEQYYQASENAVVSAGNPSNDLLSTDYKSVGAFNNHIKDSVNQAGYGTRNGVVAAGIALIYDYIAATNKRLRYSQPNRQDQEAEGIVNNNFYLDCSSFTWWAVYNGGFKRPSWPQTASQQNWAKENGYLQASTKGGQAGDFLVRNNGSEGHIIMILGTYDNGYYCAEFKGTAYGGVISKRDYSSLFAYSLINMEGYYSNASNVRS